MLVYDSFPTENGQPADRVLGQSSFTNGADNDDDQDGVMDALPTSRTLRSPRGLTVLDDRLLVADTFNEQVLIYEGR